MEQKQEKRGVSALFQPVDLTQGTCWKTILVFSLPIILSYLLQQVYSISDAAIVGQTLTAQGWQASTIPRRWCSFSCNLPLASARDSV